MGRSRAGRPLLLLSVDRGPRAVLVVGGPHPNEPIGFHTALQLLEDPLPVLPWRAARIGDLVWAREHLVPWVLRRLRHQSSGDHIVAKRPDAAPFLVRDPAQNGD